MKKILTLLIISITLFMMSYSQIGKTYTGWKQGKYVDDNNNPTGEVYLRNISLGNYVINGKEDRLIAAIFISKNHVEIKLHEKSLANKELTLSIKDNCVMKILTKDKINNSTSVDTIDKIENFTLKSFILVEDDYIRFIEHLKNQDENMDVFIEVYSNSVLIGRYNFVLPVDDFNEIYEIIQ